MNVRLIRVLADGDFRIRLYAGKPGMFWIVVDAADEIVYRGTVQRTAKHAIEEWTLCLR